MLKRLEEDYSETNIIWDKYNHLLKSLDNPDLILDTEFIKKIYDEFYAYPPNNPENRPLYELGNENIHILEDKLVFIFIQNIADGKLTNFDEIKNISKLFSVMIGDLEGRWYA